ncbi:hypothetical protein KPL70_014116 [Citrus sinensis]|nr:hypothetical protein KPL70_014116 [Citrus sinensis]
MDIKSAFLNGYIMEEVYVKQPPDLENEKFPDHVYKLSKALYGLKQAPRAWYDRLKNFLLDNDFSMGKADTTLFVKHKNQDILIVQIYVDDIIFGSTNELLCKDFSSCMSQEFEMSMMGELKYFLGLQIKQNEEGIFINQAKYVKDLLKRFGYDNGTAKSTPMSTTIKLDKDEKGKEVDIKTYRGMIGSLLYLTASRPDIMFSVCLCARFQSCPKESHMLAVKRIFRYLIGTINLGLWYPRGTHIDLTCYSDADFAGYKVDRKSTSGTCHFLGHSLVSWFSKKQNSVALSTTEVEFIAAVNSLPQNRFTSLQNRFTGLQNRKAEFALETCWNKPGFPVQEIRKTDFGRKFSKPASRNRDNWSRVHFRLTKFSIWQAVFVCLESVHEPACWLANPANRIRALYHYSSSPLLFRKGKEPVQPSTRPREARGTSSQSTFESIHFQNKQHLIKRFQQNFRTREVLNTFFVLPDVLHTLQISHRTLFQMLGDVGWIDALLIKENVYPDLVKVFYSNMDCSAEKENRVITTVGGVLIKFDDSDLDNILGSSDDGLDIFSLRKPPEIDDYVHVDAVRNICRCNDLSVEDCTIHFRTQCLCLQTHFLLRIIQSIVLPRSGHLEEVSHMDVAMIDCILRVPILEPSCRPSKGIGDEVIVGLGFEWKDGTWRRRRVSSTVASAPSASASISSPPRPPTSGDVTLQQFMDEVRTLSVRQTELQQQQQQQLIHGQRLLFEHFGIPYLFPPPSSPPE